MNFFRVQYIEVNIVGIIMLSIMLIYTLWIQRDILMEEQQYFVKMLVVNIVLFVLDTFTYVSNYHNIWYLAGINKVCCAIYFVLHGYFAYLWIIYCIKVLYPEYKMNSFKRFIISLPALAVVCLAVISIKTGWIYTITNANSYLRGKYFYLMIPLTFIYWVMGLLLDFKEILYPDRVREKNVYIILAILPIPVFISNIIQMKYYGLSVIWISIALSLLVLFINVQNNYLLRDPLTGLFNKRQINQQIMWEVKHIKNAKYYLFSIMIDVDRFKQINDTYGHSRGDKALIDVAGILKENFRKRDFIGRFGGDEFIVMGHIKERNEINILIERIKFLEREYNKKNNIYSLSLSIGYSVFDKNDNISFENFINEADSKMYNIKKQGKENI